MNPDRDLEAVKGSFERLRRQWSELQKQKLVEERTRAPRFNVFRLVGLERSEVGLHSPFLRDLLDPYGSHGQGALFLLSFFDMLAARCPSLGDIRRHLADPPDPGDWIVQTERERIDVSIRSLRARLIVFIENKIDAGEQEKQLSRYRLLLNDESTTYARRLLVFLSPRAYGPPQTGTPDVHLTYETDIARWLQTLEDRIGPLSLRGTVLQYRETIENLSGVQAMSDPALINLLAKSENIRCALETSNVIEEVKIKLRLDFWEQVATDLGNRLAELGLAEKWAIRGLDELRNDPGAVNKDDVCSVYLVSKELIEAKTHLCVGVSQAWHRDGRMISYGIFFDKEQPTPHPLTEIEALRKALPQSWYGPDAWWIGCSWTDIDTNSDEFLFRTAVDKIATARPISDRVIDLLRAHLELIQAAGQALAD